MLNIEYLGIKEQISITNKDLLNYINKLDFRTRLEFAIGTDIGTHEVSEQLTMLAAYTNKLLKENLNPAQINTLRTFLQNKLNDLP